MLILRKVGGENGSQVSNQQHPPQHIAGLIQLLFPMPRESVLQPSGHCQSPILVNKVLLEHSYSHLFPFYLWLLLFYSGRVE